MYNRPVEGRAERSTAETKGTLSHALFTLIPHGVNWYKLLLCYYQYGPTCDINAKQSTDSVWNWWQTSATFLNLDSDILFSAKPQRHSHVVLPSNHWLPSFNCLNTKSRQWECSNVEAFHCHSNPRCTWKWIENWQGNPIHWVLGISTCRWEDSRSGDIFNTEVISYSTEPRH